MPTESSNFGRYAMGGTRPVDDMGHITPNVEHSPSERPAVAFVPAPYLPAARFDEHKRAKIALSAGIPVALDTVGSLVPAGIPVGHAFKYTALDTSYAPAPKLAATGASVTAAAVSVMASGLGGNRLGHFLRPVGVTSYVVYQYEGGVAGTWPNYTVDYDNPTSFPMHNTQAQPETLNAITCDYALRVPYIWGKNLLGPEVKIFDTTANAVDVLSDNAKSYPFAHDELIRNAGTAAFGSGIELLFISPACGTGDDGSGGVLLLAGTAGAATLAVSGTGGSAGTAKDLTVAGNHILYDGTDATRYIVVKTKAAGTFAGDAGDGFTTGTITMKLAGTLEPGDYVAARLGRFVKYDPDRMDPDEKIGQVLRVRKSAIKRDYLDRVKTSFDKAVLPQHRMPGSATKGVPYLISLVSDAAQVVFETKKKLDGTALTGTISVSSLPLGVVVINLLR